jgi:hypothetical protein
MQKNPVVDKWQQKVWDSVEYDIVKEDDKMILVQTHRRELKPEDVMDDYSYAKLAVEQIESKKAEVAEQPKKYEEWMANDYPKLQEAIKRDEAAMNQLLEKFDAIAKPEYESIMKVGRDFINKFKVDKGYTRQDRYGKIEIREKALMAVADELKVDGRGHPIISDLRKECFE